MVTKRLLPDCCVCENPLRTPYAGFLFCGGSGQTSAGGRYCVGPRKWLPHLSFCYAAAAGHSIVGCIISNLNTCPHTHLQPTVVGRRWNTYAIGNDQD